MELVIDSVIIILIVVMIAYAVVLNIKLKTFRGAQNEMAILVGQLNMAITQAQATVESLKNAAQTEEARLEGLITKSRLLADELEIITQSGSNLADRIERGLLPVESRPQDDDGSKETQEDVIEGAMVEPEEEMAEEDSEMLEVLKNIR